MKNLGGLGGPEDPYYTSKAELFKGKTAQEWKALRDARRAVARKAMLSSGWYELSEATVNDHEAWHGSSTSLMQPSFR